MLKNVIRCGLIVLAMAVASPLFADSDPSVHQIYETAEAGHLAQAQRMMDQVLRDHPNSGKAHYVAAELLTRAGNPQRAREELALAEKLEPGLPFAKPASVRALQNQLSRARADDSGTAPPRRSLFGFAVLALVAFGLIAWLMRRRPLAPVASAVNPVSSPPTTPINPGAVAPPATAGVGSGIVGGLASGLAVGAGVVAGEELAHHLLDGNAGQSGSPGVASETVNQASSETNDPQLGGTDFGVSDGNSWDDAGSTQDDDNDNDWT